VKERDRLEDQKVDGRIILKLILHISNGRFCFVLVLLRMIEVERFCKDDDELSDFIKYGEFLTDSALVRFQRRALLRGVSY
jgi:hypothetical protein